MLKNKTVRNMFFVVFCLFACVSLSYAESCNSVGSTQDKYVANEPDECSYRKYTRTCCSNGTWSDWDVPCCASDTCWNGTECEERVFTKSCKDAYPGVVGGVFTRSLKGCSPGSGWSYSEWLPTSCVCASPNKWSYAEKSCIKCSWGKETTMNMPAWPDGYDNSTQAMNDCKSFRDQFVKGEVSELGKTGIEVIKDCEAKRHKRAHPIYGTYKYYWTITYKHHTCSKIY